MRRLLILFLSCLPPALSERCCAVKEVSSSLLPSMAGRYLLLGHSSVLTSVQSRCKTGCIYTKEGETGPEATQYCFEASTGGKTMCSGLGGGSCSTGEQGGPQCHLILELHIMHHLFDWIQFDTTYFRKGYMNMKKPVNHILSEGHKTHGNLISYSLVPSFPLNHYISVLEIRFVFIFHVCFMQKCFVQQNPITETCIKEPCNTWKDMSMNPKMNILCQKVRSSLLSIRGQQQWL